MPATTTATTQKKRLPPTPTLNNTASTDANQLLASSLDIDHKDFSEREIKLYSNLTTYHKAIEQKDSNIYSLKLIVLEWKKKAIDYENMYKDLRQLSEEREQFLIKQHQLEMEAMAKTHAKQQNEHLQAMIELEKENIMLRNNQESSPPSSQKATKLLQQQQFPIPSTETTQLCNSAESANNEALQSVSRSKTNFNELIQSISGMVEEMESTLHDFQTAPYNDNYCNPTATVPLLLSDSSSVCSSSSDDLSSTEEDEQPKKKRLSASKRPLAALEKKRSLMISAAVSIPNFLFRKNSGKKEIEEQQEGYFKKTFHEQPYPNPSRITSERK